jgi:hypothetical protein
MLAQIQRMYWYLEPGHLTDIVSCSIRDKNGDTILDLLRPEDTEILRLIRKAKAQASVSKADIVDGALRLFHVNSRILWYINQTTRKTAIILALGQSRTRKGLL